MLALPRVRAQRNAGPAQLPPEFHDAFKDVVLGGILAPGGMESFSDILTEADVDAIHAYLIDQAWQGYNEQEKSKGKN